MKKTFKRYAPVAAIIIIILLLANIASTLQYAKISSNYSYGVARAEPTFYQYLHKNGTEYQTNSTIGNQPSTNYVRIDDGNYQEWVQVPGMDYDRAIKLLYSKLYIEAFIGKKLRINGSSGDYAGWNVTSVDLNCDGYSDIVIGAPYNDSSDGSRTDCGCVYIFFGYEGILDKDYFDPEDANITIYGENANDRFGWSLANISHFHNTNYYDLIVGTGNITGPGKVYVFYGNDSSNWPSTMSASDANITIIGGSNGDRFGCSVGGGFDSNHDGYDDIVVGAYLNDTTDGSETDAGAVYVFFGNTLPTGVNDANITVNGKKQVIILVSPALTQVMSMIQILLKMISLQEHHLQMIQAGHTYFTAEVILTIQLSGI
ncbi:MAG: hypothetical protein L6408_00695 [Nanoarchaeota archaeon]|nr:hypothetical protein [Nanoarchaeota archaeon]